MGSGRGRSTGASGGPGMCHSPSTRLSSYSHPSRLPLFSCPKAPCLCPSGFVEDFVVQAKHGQWCRNMIGSGGLTLTLVDGAGTPVGLSVPVILGPSMRVSFLWKRQDPTDMEVLELLDKVVQRIVLRYVPSHPASTCHFSMVQVFNAVSKE